MKYLLSTLAILLMIFTGLFIYNMQVNNNFNKIIVEDDSVIIDKYYIYGVHLNIEGKFNNYNEEFMDLVLYDGNTFKKIDSIYDKGIIKLSNNINDGLYLDAIDSGKYYLFLRSSFVNQEGNTEYKYYSVKNNTKYDSTTYYTMSNIGNKIVIEFDNNYQTMSFIVKKNYDKDIYDIVVDAGHGGYLFPNNEE